jgi:hypothetical protein
MKALVSAGMIKQVICMAHTNVRWIKEIIVMKKDLFARLE